MGTDAGPMMAAAPMAAPAAVEEEEEEVEVVPEQTEFTLKMTGFGEKDKIKVIKEVKKVLPDLNLVQAKKFVEGLPQTVKENMNKAEMETMKEQLEAAGAILEVI